MLILNLCNGLSTLASVGVFYQRKLFYYFLPPKRLHENGHLRSMNNRNGETSLFKKTNGQPRHCEERCPSCGKNSTCYRLILPRKLFNKFNLFRLVRCSVLSEDVVKPDLRFFTIGHGCIPGVNGIRFSCNKAPVIRTNVFFFQ